MNAHSPVPAHGLTALAVSAEPVLRAILAGPYDTLSALAAASGGDVRNMNARLKALRAAGLIDWMPGAPSHRPVVARDGQAALDALDRAAGRAAMTTLDPSAPDPDAVTLTCDQLTPDAANPRQRSGFSPAQIEDMALSLKAEYDATGKPFITPPTVYPLDDPADRMHRIAKGERRWRGWVEAVSRGWIPGALAVACPVYLGDKTQALASAIVENLQRSDLDNLEEAEAFAKLADQLAASFTNPVPEICRQIGKSGESGERYVQERLRVARTATPEAKSRFIESRRRAAEGEPDPDPFLWKHLRDSVKVPRHITALEKSPALRLLVLEMAALADNPWDELVRVAYRPGGLLDLGFSAGLITQYQASRAACLTQTACDWLEQQGWRTAAADLLLAARTDLIGEIGVAALAPGEQVSAELNVTPTANPLPEGDTAAPEPGSDNDADEIPAYLRRLAGSPAQVKEPAPDAAPRQPTAHEQLILVEIAWRADIARGGDGFADAWGIHGDPVAMAMIPHWLLTRMGDGCTRVALTRHAQTWLAGYYEGGLTPKDLDAARYKIGFIFNTVEQLRASGRFATPWLNAPTNAPTPADAPSSPGGSPDAGAQESTRSEASAKAESDGEAEERPASPSHNLDPVALMRRSLTDLWLAAGAHYAAAQAVLAATGDSEQAAEEDDRLADAALALQRALATAATFVPADVKATLETAANG